MAVVIPAVVGAQTSTSERASVTVTLCSDNEKCHVVPEMRREGGFVGRANGREIEYLATCTGATTTHRSGTVAASSRGGIVSQLVNFDNGLACEESGRIEIRGLKDGGWYWIHGDRSSAVSPLLRKDVLSNPRVRPTNPGSPDFLFETSEDETASIVTQLSTGRIGILPHIHPEPPNQEPQRCGPRLVDENDPARGYAQLRTNCTLGDGGTFIDLHTHSTAPLRFPVQGRKVVRPSSPGDELLVGMSLWLNRTGSVIHDPDESPTFGWPSLEDDPTPLNVTDWTVAVVGPPGPTPEEAGISLREISGPNDDEGTHLVVEASPDLYCKPDEKHSVKLRIRTRTTDFNTHQPTNPVTPPIHHSVDLDGAAAEMTLDVVCPGANASSTLGVELVESGGIADER